MREGDTLPVHPARACLNGASPSSALLAQPPVEEARRAPWRPQTGAAGRCWRGTASSRRHTPASASGWPGLLGCRWGRPGRPPGPGPGFAGTPTPPASSHLRMGEARCHETAPHLNFLRVEGAWCVCCRGVQTEAAPVLPSTRPPNPPNQPASRQAAWPTSHTRGGFVHDAVHQLLGIIRFLRCLYQEVQRPGLHLQAARAELLLQPCPRGPDLLGGGLHACPVQPPLGPAAENHTPRECVERKRVARPASRSRAKLRIRVGGNAGRRRVPRI